MDIDGRRHGATAQPVSGFDIVDFRNRDNVPIAGFADLLGLLTLHPEEGAKARGLAVSRLEVGAFADPPAQRAGEGEAAHRPAVADFEDIKRRIADFEPRRGALRGWGFMPKRFQKPADAPTAFRGAE